MKVAIIGAGVLGTSLGILLRKCGHSIVAISSRNRRSAQEAIAHIGEGEVVGDPGLAAMGADVIILAVPDRHIPSVAIQVSAGGALRKGAVVAHLAGGLPAGILTGVTAAGGFRGAMHPLQSFADVDAAVRMLPETCFFIEGDREAIDVLRTLVVAIEGRPVFIDQEGKALYHAAAAAASNFLVTLVDYAVALMSQAGVPRDEALPAIMPLIEGTVQNLKTVGLPDALTGPIARGDLGTVTRHLRALETMPGDMVRLYRNLARKTVEVAMRKGGLARDDADKLLDLLEHERPDYPEEPSADAALG